MPTTIEETLKLLDRWYNEPSEGGDRPKLVSKLALLELCGWLEGTFDSIVCKVDNLTIKDAQWTKKQVIDKVSGFEYEAHLRFMLTKIVGESTLRKIEERMELNHPGDLEQMKSLLGSLWTKRCDLAHAHMVAHIAAQTKIDAPSWTLNQHRLLDKLINRYQACIESQLN